MEISAIMNIHELAIDRNEKQKADVQEERRPEESKDNPTMAEIVDSRINTMKQADTEQGTQEETLKTENIVNLVT
jgi:hypothetical protein